MKEILNTVIQEFEKDGKLCNSTLLKLKKLIVSDNPYKYSAISTAADCRAISLAPEIAKCLSSNEEMIRWICISTLLSRFQLKEYAEQGLHHAKYDSDEMVKGAAIAGLGEILCLIKDEFLKRDIALLLINTLESKSDDEYIDYRGDAYEGILAAMNISPLERPPANKDFNYDLDKDENLIKNFRKMYL